MIFSNFTKESNSWLNNYCVCYPQGRSHGICIWRTKADSIYYKPGTAMHQDNFGLSEFADLHRTDRLITNYSLIIINLEFGDDIKLLLFIH